jgi:hypothetical protein
MPPSATGGSPAELAQWLGVMARAGAGATRVCRPQIHRRAWAPPSPITADPVPHRLDARCGGMRVVFKEGRAPRAWLRSGGTIAVWQQALRATTTAGGAGVARHDSRS